MSHFAGADPIDDIKAKARLLAFGRYAPVSASPAEKKTAAAGSRSSLAQAVTRLGRHSRMVITGDSGQNDLPSGEASD